MVSLLQFYLLPVNLEDPRLGAGNRLILKALKYLETGTKSVASSNVDIADGGGS